MIPNVIGLERQEGQTISLIEVPVLDPLEQKHQPSHEEDEAHKHQDDQYIHESRLPVNRQVVRDTSATELTGIRMAATSGVTTPA